MSDGVNGEMRGGVSGEVSGGVSEAMVLVGKCVEVLVKRWC